MVVLFVKELLATYLDAPEKGEEPNGDQNNPPSGDGGCPDLFLKGVVHGSSLCLLRLGRRLAYPLRHKFGVTASVKEDHPMQFIPLHHGPPSSIRGGNAGQTALTTPRPGRGSGPTSAGEHTSRPGVCGAAVSTAAAWRPRREPCSECGRCSSAGHAACRRPPRRTTALA